MTSEDLVQVLQTSLRRMTSEDLVQALQASLRQRFKMLSLELPQTAEAMGQFIGNAIRDDLNQVQALGYLPVGIRWKEVHVDFNRFEAWPQYQVTVRWM